MSYAIAIKEFITSSKDKASAELVNAAIKADSNKIAELSKDIKILDQINTYVDKLTGSITTEKPSTAKSSKSQPKQSTNKTKAQSKNTSPATEAKSEPVTMTLADDMTNKRPVSVTIGKKTEAVNNFRSLTETACRIAYESDPSKFMALCDNPNVNGDKHQYFTKNENAIPDAVMLGTGSSAVFVDVPKLAVNNLYFLKKALTAIGYEPSKIKVTVDGNYSRKPREKKQ